MLLIKLERHIFYIYNLRNICQIYVYKQFLCLNWRNLLKPPNILEIYLAFCNVKFFFVLNLQKIYSYKYHFHWIEISMKAVLRIHTSVFVTVKYFWGSNTNLLIHVDRFVFSVSENTSDDVRRENKFP